jgi:hypothetical protein
MGISDKDRFADRQTNKFKTDSFSQGKTCSNCIHNDRCPYDHNPGKSYICWKRDPRAKV